MSSEPGGVEIAGVEIAGASGGGPGVPLYLYLTAYDGSAAFASTSDGSAGSSPVTVATGGLGVSDIFYVSPDPDELLVAADPDLFAVPPGRTQ